MSNSPIIVYTASPGGFAESTRDYHRRIVTLLETNGFRVLDPWQLTPQEEVERILAIEDPQERIKALHKMNWRITESNIGTILLADVLLATLDGQEVDSGTACEMGMAYIKGKPVFGLRSDFRQSGENDGCTINMQVEHCIHNSGGALFYSLAELEENIETIRRAGEYFRIPPGSRDRRDFGADFSPGSG